MNESNREMGLAVRRLVKVAAAEHGISVTELARRCGRSQSHIHRILHGERPLTEAMLATITQALHDGPDKVAVLDGAKATWLVTKNKAPVGAGAVTARR